MKVLEQRKKALLQQGPQIRPVWNHQPEEISTEYTAVFLSKTTAGFPLSIVKPLKVEAE